MKKKLTRTDTNFWLDFALLFNFVALLWTSSLIRFVFPSVANSQGWTLWGWSLGQWLDFQYVLLCIFSLGILVHLMLHWNWVCGVISTRFLRRQNNQHRVMDDGTRTILGVSLLIVLLHVIGGLLAIAAFYVQSPG